MKSSRERRGQFIIIAVMLTAIMIVSIGSLMYGAITYYRHEPWEEYSTLIGDIEINSRRLVELSLASYTNGADESILSTNLEEWKNDLTKIYPSSGIALTYADDDPSQGLTSKMAADFTLNITSIGLKGYSFSVETALKIVTLSKDSSVEPYTILAILTDESDEPVTGLNVNNFRINGTAPTAVSPFYERETLVYRILYDGAFPVQVKVWDQRGICVVGNVS